MVRRSTAAKGMAALLSLGLATPTAAARALVYVGNAESQDITVLEIGAGGLQFVATAAVPGPKEPGTSLPLAISPDRRFLYAGLRNEPYSVATFSIDARTGTLVYAGSGPLADSMAYIVTDRTGLYPVDYRIAPALRGTIRGLRVALVDDAISAGSAVRSTLADLESCGAVPVLSAVS